MDGSRDPFGCNGWNHGPWRERIIQQWRGGLRLHMCHVGAHHHHPTWWFWCQLGYGPKACTRHVSLCTIFWSTSPMFCPSCGVPSTRFYCELLDYRCQMRWDLTYHMCSRFLHLRYVLVNCFFDSLLKLFSFGSTARPWLESASAMSIIRNLPFQKRNGKAWSAHEFTITYEDGHENTCGFTFTHA